MGASKDLLLKMDEEHYLSIPQEVRETYLTSKRVDSVTDDWLENMKDETFASLYESKKQATKQLEVRQHQLREERRKLK